MYRAAGDARGDFEKRASNCAVAIAIAVPRRQRGVCQSENPTASESTPHAFIEAVGLGGTGSDPG
jgi:hypothetical protein